MSPSKNDTDDILSASFAHGTSMLPLGVLKTTMKTHLFGYPISHSMSPLLQNTLFEDHSIPWTYNLHESLCIPSFKELLKAPDCIGTNTARRQPPYIPVSNKLQAAASPCPTRSPSWTMSMPSPTRAA